MLIKFTLMIQMVVVMLVVRVVVIHVVVLAATVHAPWTLHTYCCCAGCAWAWLVIRDADNWHAHRSA